MDKGRGGVLRARVGGGEFLESLQREIMGNRERGGGGGGEIFSTKSWYERERVICTGKSFLLKTEVRLEIFSHFL